jgi:carboxypeptidase PM20D1
VKRLAKRAAKALALAIALLALVLVVNTLRKSAPATAAPPPPPPAAIDAARVGEHLAEAIRATTISHESAADDDATAFTSLRELLERTYPKTFATIPHETIGERALLFTWTGSDTSLKPVLFAAHMDVVPVEPGTEGRWSHPPFSGAIADGYVWGRGALDDKFALVAILEAAESLAAEGYAPKRTIYLAFGADEEVGGLRGAKLVAAALASRGVHLEYALDEGMAVTDGIMPGVAGKVALIGIAEKGYVSVEIVAEDDGGHSSMPPSVTAIDRLSAALQRLHESPMPVRLRGAPRVLLETIAPHMSFGKRLVMSNLWLFEGVVVDQMAQTPATNASIRTTTAPTMLEAGVKDNVLPTSARAVVNFRIVPGDTVASVVAHVEEAVRDPRVHVKQIGKIASDPSPEAPIDARPWGLIERTIRQFFPGLVAVAPALVVSATDGRYYAPLAGGVYHFAPSVMRKEDLRRVHGIDERASVEELAAGARFYRELLRD